MNRIFNRHNTISSPEKLTGYDWYKWNRGKKAGTKLKRNKTKRTRKLLYKTKKNIDFYETILF